MSDADARRRVMRGVLWGAFGVLAWASASLFIGTSSAQAVEEEPEPSGPLSSLITGLTSTVSDVVEPVVTEVVKPVVTEVVKPVVTEVVKPVVTEVVKPVTEAIPDTTGDIADAVADVPVVGDVAAPVLSTVSETTTAVTKPVGDLLQGDVVSSITDPVLGLVSDLPLVGGILDETGVTGTLDDLVGVVDDTTAVVGDVVAIVPEVTESLDPDAAPPADPEDAVPPPAGDDPGGTAPESSDPVGAAPVEAHVDSTAAPPAASRAPVRALDTHAQSAAQGTTAPSGDSPQVPATGTLPAGAPGPSSSAGNGGHSTGDTARLSAAATDPLRAWKRASGAVDDVLPTSPVADSDVSPD